MVSVLLVIYLWIELLGHRVILCLTFWGTIKLYTMTAPLYLPTSNVWSFQFLHTLTNTCYCLFFFFNIAILVSMKWYFIVILVLVYISRKNMMLNIFSYAYWLCVIFGEISVSCLPIFKLGCLSLCGLIVLYILWMLESYQVYDLHLYSLIL